MLPWKIFIFSPKDTSQEVLKSLKLCSLGSDSNLNLNFYYLNEINPNCMVQPHIILTDLTNYETTDPLILDDTDLLIFAFNPLKKKQIDKLAKIVDSRKNINNVLIVSNGDSMDFKSIKSLQKHQKLKTSSLDYLKTELHNQLESIPRVYSYRNSESPFLALFPGFFSSHQSNTKCVLEFLDKEIKTIQEISNSFTEEISRLIDSIGRFSQSSISCLNNIQSDLMFAYNSLKLHGTVDKFTLKRYTGKQSMSNRINSKLKSIKKSIEELKDEFIITVQGKPPFYFTSLKNSSVCKFDPRTEEVNFKEINLNEVQALRSGYVCRLEDFLVFFGNSPFSHFQNTEFYEYNLNVRSLREMDIDLYRKCSGVVGFRDSIYVFEGYAETKNRLENIKIDCRDEIRIRPIAACPERLKECFACEIDSNIWIAGNKNAKAGSKIFQYLVDEDVFKEAPWYQFIKSRSGIRLIEEVDEHLVMVFHRSYVFYNQKNPEEIKISAEIKGSLVASTSSANVFMYFITESYCKRYIYRLNPWNSQIIILRKFLI